MIFDKLEYAKNYYSIPELTQAMKLLNETDFSSLKDGRYEINEDLYYMITTYNTKPLEECKLESHKQYIDIQYALWGDEKVIYDSLLNKKPNEAYPEKDLYFYKMTDNPLYLSLPEKYFLVLYPNELHAPGLKFSRSNKVKKVVIKVRIK